MRTIRALLTASALLLCGAAQAQTACGQSLIEAEGAYYAGRLEDVRRILSNCLADGFTKDQKVEAYKLVALSWIFSRNYSAADSTLVKMLRIKPRFTPGPQDPPELQSRLDKIGARPIVGISLLAGQYLPFFHVDEVYNLGALPSDVSYIGSLGLVIGLSTSYYISKHWLIEASYESQDVEFGIVNEDDLVETRMDEYQVRRQFGVMGGYSHQWKRGFGIQAQVGVTFSSLVSANSNLYKLEKVPGFDTEIMYREQLDFSNMEHRQKNEMRPVLLLRLITQQKELPYQFNIFMRYELGLVSSVKDRYSNIPQAIQYNWIEDDFRVSYFTIGINITKIFYRVRL